MWKTIIYRFWKNYCKAWIFRVHGFSLKNTWSRNFQCWFFFYHFRPLYSIFRCFRVFAVFCHHCFLPISEQSMSQKSFLGQTRTIHAREKSMLYIIILELVSGKLSTIVFKEFVCWMNILWKLVEKQNC